jgi:hypothetical protein
MPLMAGGGLRFDPADTTVTAGDAASYMNGFWDWNGTGSPTANVAGTMTVTTHRDNNEMFLEFVIPDTTTSRPDPSNPSGNLALLVGDQVIVELDTRAQRTDNLAPGGSFRFQIRINQRQIVSATVSTRVQSLHDPTKNTWGNATDVTHGTACTPPNTAACVSLTVSSGYVVDLHIPYRALGFPNGQPSSDLGLAILVSNDIGADDAMGKHLQTAVSFPFLDMPVGTDFFNDPGLGEPSTLGDDGPGGNVWSMPSKWGAAQFAAPSADLTQLTFSHSPAFWFSNAIKISNCTALDWSDIATADTTGNQVGLNDWYQYLATKPCKMGVWVSALNSLPMMSISARVLVLWADGGLAPTDDWKVVSLSDPVSFVPGLSTMHLVWDKVPAGGSSVIGGATHPCMKVYILPASLNQAQLDIINAIHDGPTLNTFEATFVTNGLNLSGMSPQAAQMNFTNLASGSCMDTACMQAANLLQDGLLNLLGIRKADAQARDSATGDGHIIVATPVNPKAKSSGDGNGGGTGTKAPWFGVRVTGFAVPSAPPSAPYVFLTEIGGLGWAVPYTRVSDGAIKLAFNVTNPPLLYRDFSVSPIKDYPAPKRRIIMISEVHAPAGYPTPKFTLDNPTPELDAGATIVATVNVAKTTGVTTSWPQWILCLLAGNMLCWLVLLIILVVLFLLIRMLTRRPSTP